MAFGLIFFVKIFFKIRQFFQFIIKSPFFNKWGKNKLFDSRLNVEVCHHLPCSFLYLPLRPERIKKKSNGKKNCFSPA